MSDFEPADLTALSASGDGVAWTASPDGVNANLVVLGPGGTIGEHRNAEVDVLVVVVSGTTTVTVDGAAHRMPAGTAAVIPKGTARGIVAGPEGARYLTVHRARGLLGIRAGAPGA